MEQQTTITVTSNIINEKDIESILSQYCTLSSHISRNMFNYLIHTDNPDYNKLTRDYVKKYKIHTRLCNSIKFQVMGEISSIKSLNKNIPNLLKNHIKDKKKKLVKLEDIKDEKKKNLYTFKTKSKINNLLQRIDNNRDKKVQRVWGGLQLYRKQWSCLDKDTWSTEWKIKRDHHLFLVGSKDESFGNSLCQLQTLQKLRLTLPKNDNFSERYLNLEVNFDKDKKNYLYLKNAINNCQALTYNIYQNSDNLHWYVSISFALSNECTDNNNGTIGVDLNYNLIATTLIKQDGNKEEFRNFTFELTKDNKHKNTQILSDIANEIVQLAKDNHKSITIEKLDLKNVVKDEKISYVVSHKFFSLLRSRCVKNGILLIEVNPTYTSIIGELKYMKRFGVSRHASASYVTGRRGLNYVESIPGKYICLLQRGERDKSLLSMWNILDKRLNEFSKKVKSKYLQSIYLDHTTFNLNCLSLFD